MGHACWGATHCIRAVRHACPRTHFVCHAKTTAMRACMLPHAAAAPEEEEGESVDESGVEAKDIELVMQQVRGCDCFFWGCTGLRGLSRGARACELQEVGLL